jgi:hypothetical protein
MRSTTIRISPAATRRSSVTGPAPYPPGRYRCRSRTVSGESRSVACTRAIPSVRGRSIESFSSTAEARDLATGRDHGKPPGSRRESRPASEWCWSARTTAAGRDTALGLFGGNCGSAETGYPWDDRSGFLTGEPLLELPHGPLEERPIGGIIRKVPRVAQGLAIDRERPLDPGPSRRRSVAPEQKLNPPGLRFRLSYGSHTWKYGLGGPSVEIRINLERLERQSCAKPQTEKHNGRPEDGGCRSQRVRPPFEATRALA